MKFFTRRTVAFIILAIIYGFIIFYVWNVITFYSLNPFEQPTKESSIPIMLYYPAFSEGKLSDIAAEVRTFLVADDIIAEGVNMTFLFSNTTGVAIKTNPIGNEIASIWVGFRHAGLRNVWVFNGSYYDTLAGVWLKPEDNQSESKNYVTFSPIMTDKFNFPVSGDYSPSIIVELKNETFLAATDKEIKVHVLSKGELRSQELDQVNVVVAIVLLVFAFIEGIAVVNSLTKEEKTNYQYTCSWGDG
jgi:hypothetical protein